jgi:TRAP-type mannitol/chloroaromatic compound transport system permease large subunit
MTAFLIDNMAPIMFAALVITLLLGYPAAFSLGAVGLIFAVVGIELGQFHPDFLQALPERVYGVMNNDTLLAIPFFTFMGLVLERSGMAEDLLDTIGQLFGTIRGGLAYAVVFVGALLAATTGVVAASVISMGLISLPIMLRYGYDRRMATGHHRRFRHPGPDHSALPGADRDGRPARQVGR